MNVILSGVLDTWVELSVWPKWSQGLSASAYNAANTWV